ncbi:hypothetical protein Zm00014a_011415 [Zea mays]|uniref:Uncharacterized protein n=1 Tax=Zea mays TaxID=4577 RepID=A0A317YJ93_MAIZE|nr:hypothetical protein Zm00014a_011415 [Zea mays]
MDKRKGEQHGCDRASPERLGWEKNSSSTRLSAQGNQHRIWGRVGTMGELMAGAGEGDKGDRGAGTLGKGSRHGWVRCRKRGPGRTPNRTMDAAGKLHGIHGRGSSASSPTRGRDGQEDEQRRPAMVEPGEDEGGCGERTPEEGDGGQRHFEQARREELAGKRSPEGERKAGRD